MTDNRCVEYPQDGSAHVQEPAALLYRKSLYMSQGLQGICTIREE